MVISWIWIHIRYPDLPKRLDPDFINAEPQRRKNAYHEISYVCSFKGRIKYSYGSSRVVRAQSTYMHKKNLLICPDAGPYSAAHSGGPEPPGSQSCGPVLRLHADIGGDRLLLSLLPPTGIGKIQEANQTEKKKDIFFISPKFGNSSSALYHQSIDSFFSHMRVLLGVAYTVKV